MFGDIQFPEEMSRGDLDEYLARGWFRMGQSIFTTDEFPFRGIWHSVYWLRICLSDINYSKSARRISHNNRSLPFSIVPFELSAEMEELYHVYRSAVEFEAPESVTGYLFGERQGNIYDTQVIEIRENNKLIAAGIFDQGENSIAGIMNFYRPEYRSRSLGKYLMLLKIGYALHTGRRYYYPGYIAKGFPKFDYKYFPDPGATEVYDQVNHEWIPLSLFLQDKVAGSGNIMANDRSEP